MGLFLFPKLSFSILSDRKLSEANFCDMGSFIPFVYDTLIFSSDYMLFGTDSPLF
jgi:hypothetical protein